MSSTHLETCSLMVILTKYYGKLAAFRFFLSEEKRLIRNFCPLLRSQEWQEGKFLICYSIFGCTTKFT